MQAEKAQGQVVGNNDTSHEVDFCAGVHQGRVFRPRVHNCSVLCCSWLRAVSEINLSILVWIWATGCHICWIYVSLTTYYCLGKFTQAVCSMLGGLSGAMGLNCPGRKC